MGLHLLWISIAQISLCSVLQLFSQTCQNIPEVPNLNVNEVYGGKNSKCFLVSGQPIGMESKWGFVYKRSVAVSGVGWDLDAGDRMVATWSLLLLVASGATIQCPDGTTYAVESQCCELPAGLFLGPLSWHSDGAGSKLCLHHPKWQPAITEAFLTVTHLWCHSSLPDIQM